MNSNTEFSIDLIGLFHYIKKKAPIIIAVTVVFAILGFCISSYFIAPEYTASTRLYVLNKSATAGSVTYSDIQISTSFLKDYKVLITGQNVTKQVISDLGLTMTPNEVAEMISVTAPDDTRVLQISVTDVSAQRAASIANRVREVASEQITDIMDADAVNLVYATDIPTSPSSPNIPKNTVIATALGFILVVGIYAIKFVLDDTIRTEEDIERYLQIPTLGVVPASSELSALGKGGKTGQLTGKKKK